MFWSIFTVEITSASISTFLSECNRMDINLNHVQYVDDLRVKFHVSSTDYDKIKLLAEKHGATLQILRKRGVQLFLQNWLRRPILLVGIAIWLMAVFYMPTRVLFVQVDGNHSVESLTILEAAEKCGIRFGASRRYVRSEKVKNALLSEIDTLQWAGVNTKGCVAVISVKERFTPQSSPVDKRISSIVAARDGIISNITVTKGNPVCKVGQAVRSGQVLVSAYTDCGLSIRAESADAEITALTNHAFTAVTLSGGTIRTAEKEKYVRYSIQIGKNIVKLFHDSRISDHSCVKIYDKAFLTLPGGFQLPVSLIKETILTYNVETAQAIDNSDFDWMFDSAETYLKSDMIAGEIIHKNVLSEQSDNIFSLTANYVCREEIGQVRIEEIGENNGERNS